MPASGFQKADWDKLAKRYRNADSRLAPVMKGVVVWAQANAVKEAQHQLDTLVYKAPLPPSAGPGYERTGRTRQAVQSQTPSGFRGRYTGTVKVLSAIANREGFYYPAVLNKGISGTRYYARPFWTATVALMKARMHTYGRQALRDVRAKLLV